MGDGISEKTGFELGRLAGQLPDGTFKLDTEIPNADLGWGLGGYRFAKYKKSKSKPAKLIPDGGRPQRRLIEGSYIARDLINIPASDMGPDALEKAFRKIAAKHKAAHPNFSLEHWSTVVPDRLEEDTQNFVEGLKKAGF